MSNDVCLLDRPVGFEGMDSRSHTRRSVQHGCRTPLPAQDSLSTADVMSLPSFWYGHNTPEAAYALMLLSSDAELAFWRQTARQNSMLTGGPSSSTSNGLFDSFRDAGISCQICNVSMNSYAQLLQHQSGSKHKSQVCRRPDLCLMVLGAAAANHTHLAGMGRQRRSSKQRRLLLRTQC